MGTATGEQCECKRHTPTIATLRAANTWPASRAERHDCSNSRPTQTRQTNPAIFRKHPAIVCVGAPRPVTGHLASQRRRAGAPHQHQCPTKRRAAAAANTSAVPAPRPSSQFARGAPLTKGMMAYSWRPREKETLLQVAGARWVRDTSNRTSSDDSFRVWARRSGGRRARGGAFAAPPNVACSRFAALRGHHRCAWYRRLCLVCDGAPWRSMDCAPSKAATAKQ
ncbi:unnamed protein product [Ostreobium quekettii]|uniref:Uncharacterized protein n=1 Tax=Ostreobium quekettii TaxID=121088 RepID=A0A8S1ILC3_9CHLO|nr:unnamed protein product [Ostreobium quekettii]